MPKVGNTVPRWIRPYRFHRVAFSGQSGSQHYGECPWCGKTKFYVGEETGKCDCKSCGFTGNPILFLRRLWEVGQEKTTEEMLEGLCADRRLLYAASLEQWGAVKSVLTDEWLLPGYAADKSLSQLYRYARWNDGGHRILPTQEMQHGLHGLPLWNPDKPTCYICEGFWDGVALWEILRCTRRMDNGSLMLTANEDVSLAAEANVVATPGANVFAEAWLPLFSGKRVVLLYDNDHPYTSGNQKCEGAGPAGMRRHAQLLTSTGDEAPAEIAYLKWGELGYDPQLKTGYDVRDRLMEGEGPSQRVGALSRLLERVQPIPKEWSGKRRSLSVSGVRNKENLECLQCSSWKTLIVAWRKAMRWSESGKGLDHALAVMLACVTSTRAVGDQLWVKIIGPASSGKTTLCEALSIAKKYIYPKDTLTRLTSGYQVDGEGSEDMSMAPRLKDKTLVINDGDTILQLANKEQVLAQLRAFYGRNLRTQYGNKMSKDHIGINMTLILCGTESLRSLDTSELGERFLDCEVVDKIDEDQEYEVALKVAYRAAREMALISDGKADSRDGPEMVLAKQLTGGYVCHLRENAQWLLEAIPDSDEAMLRCVTLGTFVAYMRARPSPKQEEKAQREMCYRLTSQMVRLAKCMAVVLNEDTLNDTVMQRVTKVALDTARGRTLEIVKVLTKNPHGLTTESVAFLTQQVVEKEAVYLRFLRKIGVVELFKRELGYGVNSKPLWRLSSRVTKLYNDVVGSPAVALSVEEDEDA